MKTACLSVISVSVSDVGEPLISIITVKLATVYTHVHLPCFKQNILNYISL